MPGKRADDCAGGLSSRRTMLLAPPAAESQIKNFGTQFAQQCAELQIDGYKSNTRKRQHWSQRWTGVEPRGSCTVKPWPLHIQARHVHSHKVPHRQRLATSSVAIQGIRRRERHVKTRRMLGCTRTTAFVGPFDSMPGLAHYVIRVTSSS